MLRHLVVRTAWTIGLALSLTGPAAAQYYPPGGWYRSGPPSGYWVRSYGYYDGYHSPPGYGGYETYHEGRPFVTVADPWGRVAEVPLRPKVLYYSDQFVTPHGSFYPTHVVVIPNDRRPAPIRSSYPPPPAARPAASPPGPATDASGPVGPTPTSPENRIPPAADHDPRPAPEAPTLPAVPELPRLPDVAAVPGSIPQAAVGDPKGPDPSKKPGTAPKLGPTPMDTSTPK